LGVLGGGGLKAIAFIQVAQQVGVSGGGDFSGLLDRQQKRQQVTAHAGAVPQGACSFWQQRQRAQAGAPRIEGVHCR
jgi:hypothetical protein